MFAIYPLVLWKLSDLTNLEKGENNSCGQILEEWVVGRQKLDKRQDVLEVLLLVQFRELSHDIG